MLNDKELEKYMDNLPEETKQYIRRVRNSEPSRRTGLNARDCVSSQVWAEKMQQSEQAESQLERSYLTKWLYDDEVLEFWFQLPTEEVYTYDKNGRGAVRTIYTDALVLCKDELYVANIKPKKEALKLSESHPKNWVCKDSGFYYLPGVEAYKKYSLGYRVLTDENINQIEMANIRLMLNVMQSEDLDKGFLKRAEKVLQEYSWIRLKELAEFLGEVSYDRLYRLIADKKIYCALKDELLIQPESVWVSCSQELLKEAMKQNPLPLFKRFIIEDLIVPTKKQGDHALEMVGKCTDDPKGRSARRFREYVSKGGKKTMFEFFIPNNSAKGNRNPKRSVVVLDYLKNFISEVYSGKGKPDKNAAYIEYCEAARRVHPQYKEVDKKTFYKYVDMSNQVELIEKREGKRAANKKKDFIDVLDVNLRGTYPFESASFDTKLLKIYMIIAVVMEELYVIRPYLVSLLDECTDMILAQWLSVFPPSRHSVAMIYRECVREFGRIPLNMHCDRGSENDSNYHLKLAANLSCSLDWSPAGNPIFNSKVERFHRDIDTRYSKHTPSFFKDVKYSRSMSPGTRPQELAVLTPEKIVEEIKIFRDSYNRTPVGNNCYSPEHLLYERLQKFKGAGISQCINDEFTVKTSVELNGADFKIGERGSIQKNGIHFTHPSLRTYRPTKSSLEVREDPEDPYKLYFHYGGKWETALSRDERVFLTKNSIERHAEAIRVMHGRTLRDEAKKNAQIMMINKLHEVREDNQANKIPIFENECSNVKSESKDAFEEVLLQDIPDLSVKPWA